MVDYRRFLGAAEEIVAPFLGGATIVTAHRALRLRAAPAAPGWYRFAVKGREATVLGPTDAPALSTLPRVRGHGWNGRLVTEGAKTEPLALLPGEDLPLLSPLSARRWYDGALLFEQVEFESDAEGAAREALAVGTGLHVRGAPATLRAAWALALTERVARRLQLPACPAELRRSIATIADEGIAAAERALRALQAERELALRELRDLQQRLDRQAQEAELVEARLQRLRDAEARHRNRGGDRLEDLLADALQRAGATFEHVRRLGDDRIEVVFAFMGERFIAIAHATTWQVFDSGICLGHPPRDDLITLESLPSVIREAIETDQLVILRYP